MFFLDVFSVGTYQNEQARKHMITIISAFVETSANDTDTNAGGQKKQNVTILFSRPFHFIQLEDGTIPVTYFPKEDAHQVVNVKKAIVSAFQANFKGTKTKQEADPQSLHNAEYRFVYSH